MFKNKDYKDFFQELYAIEIDMKKEARILLKLIQIPEAQIILKQIIADEIRHARLVKKFIDFI